MTTSDAFLKTKTDDTLVIDTHSKLISKKFGKNDGLVSLLEFIQDAGGLTREANILMLITICFASGRLYGREEQKELQLAAEKISLEVERALSSTKENGKP